MMDSAQIGYARQLWRTGHVIPMARAVGTQPPTVPVDNFVQNPVENRWQAPSMRVELSLMTKAAANSPMNSISCYDDGYLPQVLPVIGSQCELLSNCLNPDSRLNLVPVRVPHG